MPYSVTATVFPGLPGAVQLDVAGDPGGLGSTARLVRVDGAEAAQPVRNFDGVPESGADTVVDCEAPLGRPVTYLLQDFRGATLASAGPITCPPLPDGRGILRSVLRPQVQWMKVEPQDETGVEWGTSTTVHRIVGSDTPVVVGEVRQRRTGTMTFLCRSTGDADRLVALCGDGSLMLLRVDPCASAQVRDLLFTPLDVGERRWGRQGWRLVWVDYQASRFVAGATQEPPLGQWSFDALAAAAVDFDGLAALYADFASMALDVRQVSP